MTLSSETSTKTYSGDGSTAAFPTTFRFLANADVEVLLVDADGNATAWTEGTHYALSGAGSDAGGTVTAATSPTDHRPKAGETLLIRRAAALLQPIDLPVGGLLPSAAVEEIGDRLTMLVQQVLEQVERAVRGPRQDVGDDFELPVKAQRSGGFLAFDAAGAMEIRHGNGVGSLAAAKNKLINGAFDIWQRGTSFGAGSGYTADRWHRGSDGCTLTREAFALGQTAVPGEPAYFLRFQETAGTGTPALAQRVEGVRTLAGQAATVSFWARVASGTLAVPVSLQQNFGTGGSPNAPVSTAAGTANVTTAWQRFTLTATLPSLAGKTLGTNGNDYVAVILPFAGLGAFTLDLALAQLEAGATATAFEQRPQALEEALAMRYFESAVGPGTNKPVAAGFVRDTTHASGLWHFKTRKRQAPIVSFKGASSDYEVASANTFTAATNVSALSVTVDTAELYFTVASGLTEGKGVFLRYANGSGLMQASAEL